jgi:putative N-acetyltransferase (TIGR04045 family)
MSAAIACLWDAAVRPYRSAHVVTLFASEAWQHEGYWDLRTRVFVGEQRLFDGSDRDEHDTDAIPIVALSTAAGMLDQVIGAVRVYPAGGGTWFGGRLAVCPVYRRQGEVGSALIRTAVGGARGLGARRFLATVQIENVRYFERHHFRSLEPFELRGHPHHLMEADLAAFEVPPSLAALASKPASEAA